jgi:Co/Zn/Cd efflux system component
MSDTCGASCASEKPPVDPRYRSILWLALAVNISMFVIELAGGWAAGSVALLADAVDFFGDAANYGVSLFVLSLAPVWRSRAALFKGVTMGGYGLFVLAAAAWNLSRGIVPDPATMGVIGFLALLSNVAVAVLLYAYRTGDANMRSVWLCSRNDAIGNVAVMLAALGVFGTSSGWPDIAVATIMGVLGLSAARTVIAQAGKELSTNSKENPR